MQKKANIDENWKQITEFTEKYKDTLVLDYTEVKVLRGCIDDTDPETMDYYWLLQDKRSNFVQSSCVGEIIALKGVIPEDSYNRLRSMLSI